MNIPTAQLYLGDCLDVLKTLPDGSVDAVITDRRMARRSQTMTGMGIGGARLTQSQETKIKRLACRCWNTQNGLVH